MGKSGGGGSGAHDYFGSIAGLVCAGPVTGLVAIAQDKKVIWPTAQPWSQNVPVAYAVGDLASYGGRVWRCVIAHTSGLYWPPGSTPEWEPYFLRRTDPGIGNPAVLTVLNYGSAILYWGTEDQVLDAASEPTFAAQHPP
ncbi:MAG: carbohydrate-binding protein, partial [Verrucomicrobiota bacterium]